jgi:hypothetical protein
MPYCTAVLVTSGCDLREVNALPLQFATSGNIALHSVRQSLHELVCTQCCRCSTHIYRDVMPRCILKSMLCLTL